jgi:hypothetical protein
MVNWSERMPVSTSCQVSGAETVAPGLALVENAATAVAPLPFRR